MQLITIQWSDGWKKSSVRLQASRRSGKVSRPLTVDSEDVLKVLEEDLTSNALRVWGEFGISQSGVFHVLHVLSKTHSEEPNCTWRYQIIAELLTHPSYIKYSCFYCVELKLLVVEYLFSFLLFVNIGL